MKTLKQQAAEARDAGLKRFISDQPCRYGHHERRADKQGTCIACDRRLHKIGPISYRWSGVASSH
jgi:hypothetical protein